MTHVFRLAVWSTLLVSPSVIEAATWKAGAASVNITPKVPLAMSGYGGRDAPAVEKLTDLWVKALVLETETDRAVVVTLDLVGIHRSLSQQICRLLQSTFPLERHQIAICCSHTHTGPVVGKNLAPLHYMIQTEEQQQRIDDYAEALPHHVAKAVRAAFDNLEDSRLSWGTGNCTFAVNRRENKPYEQARRWRTAGALQGPVDHAVPVLAVRDLDNELKAVLFGYACHATVLSLGKWSGDYPGYAQLELERLHPECVALFWAGCGADQNPLPRSTVPLARHYGQRLATAVESVLLTHEMPPLTPRLRTSYQEIELPFGTLPSPEEINQNLTSSDRYEAARARLLLQELERGPLGKTYPYPISYWELGGEVEFVALGGEVVVDFALRLKTELRAAKTWVAGYAHDVMAYIPSRRVLAEGGYEGATAMVYYGLPTSWSPLVENMIVMEVHRQASGE